MAIEFDPAKDLINRTKHGLSLANFVGFDANPTVRVDDRYGYGETRYRAWGWIDGLSYCLAFTFTATGTRVISFRRAHATEMRRYE